MIIKEYRITMPLSVAEFQIGQRFSIARASLAETGGGEGVEVVKNEPFHNYPLFDGSVNSGQYTYKIYHLDSKVPSLVRMMFSKGALQVHEEAWNAYPFCRTVLTNPDCMKDDFFIHVDSIHLADRGKTENAHNLSDEELEQREVVKINIADDDSEHLQQADLNAETSPSCFISEKTGRGPLQNGWAEEIEPVMCIYKLVKVHFKWWGLQRRVENFIHKTEGRLFSKFHREVFCWIDDWFSLTMEEVKAVEDETQERMNLDRENGSVRGIKG